MPPSKSSPWISAIWRSVLSLACAAVSFLPPCARADDPKEKSVPSGIDALEVVRVVFIPNRNQQRMRVMSIDVPGVVKKPEDITVQLNVLDPNNRTFFLPVGADVPAITFRKVEEIGVAPTFTRTKFNVKSYKNIVVNGQDVSEITLWDYEYSAEIVLPLRKIVDVLDLDRCHAILRYKWRQVGEPSTPDFSKRTGQSFTLKPDETTKYKVLEITKDSVLIELPDGTRKTLTVPK